MTGTSPAPLRLTRQERTASMTLGAVFALRLLGIFLILPVFSVWAQTLEGGTDAFMVGMALGIYGLTQAVLQIPFGAASDRFGRKPVIVTGLLIFIAGSLLAYSADNITTLLIARAIQGAGAVSAGGPPPRFGCRHRHDFRQRSGTAPHSRHGLRWRLNRR